MDGKETVRCPWCGGEMTLHGVDTIIHSAWYKCWKCRAVSPYAREDSDARAKEAAYAAAMQRVEPENRVLTLEEIESIQSPWPYSTPPYFSFECFNHRGELCEGWTSFSTVHGVLDGSITSRYSRHNYGTEWRCWLRKPTEEERARKTMKDINGSGCWVCVNPNCPHALEYEHPLDASGVCPTFMPRIGGVSK